tara:strand:- start:103 stop:3372 length:3270 start_codon:yes stop_codon:yes gene_type:complete
MIIDSTTIESVNQSDLDQIPQKLLLRRFGMSNDSIELNIFDSNGEVILSDELFTDYTPYLSPNDNLIDSIDIDYEQVLKDYGFIRGGQYKLSFSFQRKILTQGIRKTFFITEISPSRTEIRFSSNILNEDSLNNRVEQLNSIFAASSYFKDINLTFGKGNSVLAINSEADLITNTGIIKLYTPLPPTLGINSSFRVYEEIINPIEVTVNLESSEIIDDGISLSGPNFNIDYTDNFTVPSNFRTYDEILNSGAITSSFNNIQNYLSSSISIDLEFDNPDTPSGYHFENFIHYSSATERLKNFKYKLELLESYSSSLAILNNISGSVTSSNPIFQNTAIYNTKTDKIIQGFDYYERYLYYEKGPYAWPKTTTAKPHTNAKINSAAATSWFGAPIDDYENDYFGGMMLSASKYDDCNPYYIGKTIPPDIRNNPQNEAYVLFTEMIAQHFDGIWAYIDSITDKYQADSGLNDGISKELVFNALTERGIRAYSQFENSSIYEYFLGDDGQGSFQYEPTDGSTMISASNAGSIPKGDITKEIWKRLYHNSPYLLKTKGTERGLKALIATYGIPESVLHIKEYGGPLVDKTGFRTFSYQKESKMHTVHNDGESFALAVFNANFLPEPAPANESTRTKTIQTRFLPIQGSNTSYDIITILTGGDDLSVGISQSIDNTKIESGSLAHLVISSGSNGTLVSKTSSPLGPIFNGSVWNLSITFDSGSENTMTAYATQATFNKNTHILSCSLDLHPFFANLSTVESSNADYYVGHSYNGVSTTLKPLLGPFTGSIQEHRAWHERLTEATIVTQSLSPFNYNGNTISSSYEALYLRNPLGSNLHDVPATNDTNNNFAPKKAHRDAYGASVYADATSSFLEETHHLPTPDTVGSGMVSDKIRIDNGTFDDNFLDPFTSVETSPQDRQPLDFSDLGVFFSPTFEINEDIIYTLGGFRLDDYIGDPTFYTSGSYPDLKTIRDIYFQKVDKKYNFQDYIRTIQFFDHTLFKMIKDFTPAKANLKTGLVIEPHYLERAKIPGKNIDYEQKTEHLAAYYLSGSLSNSTVETEHNVVINVVDYILTGSESTANENVAQKGRLSKKLFIA